MTAGSSALADTDVSLGGELGMSAVVGLSKGGEAFDYSSSISINIDIDHSTDYGLMFGGDLSLATLDTFEFEAYDYTDRRGVKEHRIFRITAPGPTNIMGEVYGVSGGAAVDPSEIVAVKINSDWLSLGSTRSHVQFPLPPRMAQNVCKLAGRLADDMAGRSASFGILPPAPTVAPVFRTHVGNGLYRDDQIFIANSGSTGNYAPAGQFLAKRAIWATGTITTTVNIGTPPSVNGWAQRIGARVSVHPLGSLVGATSRPGTAAAVFQTRFESVKISPDQITSGTQPQLVYQSTVSNAATVLFNPGSDEQDQQKVNFAQVYVGPFAEIRTIGSSEKLVTGAVCFEQDPFDNETNAFMQPVSKLLSHTAASIYVEGGFGRVTVSTRDDSGIITSDGPWGDTVSLSAENGVVVSADTNGALFGIMGTVAAVPQVQSRTLDTIVGAKVDLGAIALATDIHFDPAVTGFLDAWQLEAALIPTSLSRVGLVFDSDDRWWVEAVFGGSAFLVEAQAGLPDGHLPGEPVYWWVNSELNVNGATLSGEYHQQGDLAFGLQVDVGAGEVFARVEQEDDIVNLRFGTTLAF